jgi:hypothetical protein
VPTDNPDLRGNVPDKAAAALLLIDIINDLEFDSGEALFGQMLPMATRLGHPEGTGTTGRYSGHLRQ